MALDMARKISFKPTSRRSSHVLTPETGSPGTGHGAELSRASAQVTQVFGTHNRSKPGKRRQPAALSS